MKYILFFILTAILILSGCKAKEPVIVQKTPVPVEFVCSIPPSFEKDIKPVLFQHCASCHSDSNYGFNLLLVEDTRKMARTGELIGTINHIEGYPAMPQSGDKLGADLIKLIECWIKTDMKD